MMTISPGFSVAASNFLDIGPKPSPLIGPSMQPRRLDTVEPKGGEEGYRPSKCVICTAVGVQEMSASRSTGRKRRTDYRIGTQRDASTSCRLPHCLRGFAKMVVSQRRSFGKSFDNSLSLCGVLD